MRGRRVAIAAWLAALALCAWAATQARYVADLSSFLPAAPTPAQRLLVDQLRDGALSRVMLVGIEGADAATRARLSRDLAAALSADARFTAVANGSDAGHARERAFVLAHRYALSPEVTPERFAVEGLRAAIGETLELLASPAGLALKALVARDPTGETLAVIDALRPPEGPPLQDGVWQSPDGQRAVLVARTRASGSDIDAQAGAIEAVQAAFARARAAAGDGAREARVAMTGPGVFSARSREMIERDVKRLSGLGMAIIVALLLAVYRSPRALLLGLVPVATGALAGLAAVALGFGVVHGITVGFGIALIGEAVDYSIYLLVQSEHGRDGDPAWLARFWPTVRLGVLTSIAGFSALLFSGLPGLAQLGLYAIAGLVAAALATRFVLPRMVPAGFRMRDVTGIGRAFARVAAIASRGRWAMALVAAVAIAALAANRDTLWDPEVASLNPIPAADRALDGELRSALGAADARHMVAVAGESPDAALQAAEAAGRALDALVADGRLGGYDSPARFLPSEATQRARLASLPDEATLRARLREALAGSPLRAEKLEPFIADVAIAKSQGPMARESLAGTALESAVEGMLFREGGGRWMAVLGLRAPGGRAGIDAAAVRAALDGAGLRDALVLDLRAEADRLYAGYFGRALAMSGVGLAIIVALLGFALRDARRVARVMAPLATAVLAVAALHALAGERLTLMHLVGLLLVVAIGSNYSLFFEGLGALAGPAAERTLASLALANATTVAGYGVLAFSSIPVLHAIGATVAGGALLALAFAAMIEPRRVG